MSNFLLVQSWNELNNKKYFTWFRVGNNNLNNPKYPDNGKSGIEYKVEWKLPTTEEDIQEFCDRSKGDWYSADDSVISHEADDRKYINYKEGEIEIAWVILKLPADKFLRTLWQLAFEVRAVDQNIIKQNDPELAQHLLSPSESEPKRILQAENKSKDDSGSFEQISENDSDKSSPENLSQIDLDDVEFEDVEFEENES